MIATKTEELCQRLMQINRLCFKGVECPKEAPFRYEFNRGTVYTVAIAEVIIGYALISRWASGPFLWNIAVIPQYRGLGLGTQLLREIFFVEENEPIELTVNVNNPAQKLYFDEGFRAVRVIPKYYGSEAGIRMRRN